MRSPTTTEKLLQRVDELIAMGNAVLGTRHHDSHSSPYANWMARGGRVPVRQVKGPELVDSGKMKEFRAASLSFIRNVYDENHPYYTEFLRIGDGFDTHPIELGLGMLHAIRGEIEGGWLFTVKGRVTTEVFTDYMKMAEYLLLELELKDPAAVIAGSTLEAHLRQLCTRNSIPVTQPKNGKNVPVKADRLNNDLATTHICSELDHKSVMAWLELRNNAAHGKYGEYNADQVKGMITGVLEFMARNAV